MATSEQSHRQHLIRATEREEELVMSVMADGSKTYFLMFGKLISLTHTLLLQAMINQIHIWITTQLEQTECPCNKEQNSNSAFFSPFIILSA